MKQDTLEGKAKTKNGVKRLCFSIVCILLEVIFIITIVTRLNEYAEIINLFTRILSGILVLGLYASDKIISIVSPVAAPVKRLVQNARDNGDAVDATCGRKTKAVIIMENKTVVLSSLLPETIVTRLNG